MKKDPKQKYRTQQEIETAVHEILKDIEFPYPVKTGSVSSPAALHSQIKGLSHINIGVDNLDTAIHFYGRLFQVKPQRIFRRFNNTGFAKSAGFLSNPHKVEVSIAFVELPGAGITLELMEYHQPKARSLNEQYQVNDVGGVRHIALQVTQIDEAFQHVKSLPEVRFINPSVHYKPFKIDPIKPHEFSFYNAKAEANPQEKERVCEIVGQIRYFYFIDPYHVQWEFEQGHEGV